MLTIRDLAPIRILHCDDHEPMRALLAGMLHGQPGLQMVAQVASHAEAVTRALELQPDLVILDLDAERDEHVVDKLRAGTAARILVLSGDADLPSDLLVSQADGFIAKAAGSEGIMQAIRVAASQTPHAIASAA